MNSILKKIIVSTAGLLIGSTACGIILTHAFETAETESNENELIPLTNAENTSALENTKSVQMTTVPDDGIFLTDYTTAQETNDQKTVWHKMLNSIDYYDTISGTTVYNVGDITNCTVVNFESDIISGKARTTVAEVNMDNPKQTLAATGISYSDCDVESDITIISDGEDVYYLDNSELSYFVRDNAAVKRENMSAVSDEERYWINENGEPCCFLRNDATNTGYAKRCIFSQELAIGYLHDFNLWTVDSIEKYNGRKCYIVSGTAEDEYGAKLNVEKFELYVDFETGVLLKYEGYSSSGELTRFLYTDNIKIDEGVSINEEIDLSMYKKKS